MLSRSDQPLSSRVKQRIAAYPASGEINFKVEDTDRVIRGIEDHFSNTASLVDYTDGLSMEFEKWRFNLRASNTEPTLRLNVESRADSALMHNMTEHLKFLIQRNPKVIHSIFVADIRNCIPY